MSIEDPRLSSIDNTSAADDFDSAVEQHLGYASETVGGIEVAQAETPDATRTDRLPAQTPPVEVAAATIPTEVKPNEQNVVTLPAGIELDNLEFEVDGENLVLVLADGTEIVVLGGAANIPTFVIGDVELPQVALFAALEGSNINVAAGPDGTFSAQGTPDGSRNFNDDPIEAGPEDFALTDLLGDTSFEDELQTAATFGGDGQPSITPLEGSFIYDEAVIAGGEGQKIITGTLPFNPGPDSGAISAIGFVGASDVDEGDGLKVLTGFTSGGRPITVTSVPEELTGPDFLALQGLDSAGGLVFTISVNRASGDFTFELFGKLEHPDAGQNGSQDDLEDLLRLSFTYRVTDLDGDFVDGTFDIDVQDDAPTIGTPEGDSVNENDVPGDFDGPSPAFVKVISDSETDGETEMASRPEFPTAGGSLAIRWGADDDFKSEDMDDGNPNDDDPVGRTVSFTGLTTASNYADIVAAIPALAGLRSDGVLLDYRIERTVVNGLWNGGYQLIAFKEFRDEPIDEEGSDLSDARILKGDFYGDVFIITLDPTSTNGTYTFELIGNLDHYEPVAPVDENEEEPPVDLSPSDGPELQVFLTEDTANSKGEQVDVLEFKIPFTATDSDGDSVSGTVTVNVQDDKPVFTGETIVATVDEDDIETKYSTGTSPRDGADEDKSYTGETWFEQPGPATVSGYLDSLVDFGADSRWHDARFSIDDTPEVLNTLSKLTSNGDPISYAVRFGTLYGYVDNPEGGPAFGEDDRVVFTLEVSSSGYYSFKLFGQLDHVAPGSGADENLTLRPGITTINFGAVIKATDYDDDSITLGNAFSIQVRDDVPVAKENPLIQLDDDVLTGGIPGGPGDDVETAVLTGTLGHESGADGVESILWASDGIEVPFGFWFERSADGKTMTITQNQGEGEDNYVAVFKAVITDTLTGAYEIVQLAPVKHAEGTIPGTEDNRPNIAFQYLVTDGDGDSARGTISFNVDDDTPTVDDNALIQLDDDALAGGIPGGTDDAVETALLTGTLAHKGGADGTASVLWAPDGIDVPFGFWFELSTDGKTMTITQNQGEGEDNYVPVFKAVITDSLTGAYEITQLAPVKHGTAGTEDNAEVSFQYRVTDGDGDVATGKLTVNIDDDAPVANNVEVARQLDDEGQPNGNPGAGLLFADSDAPGEDVTASGGAGTLFKAGADGLKSVSVVAPTFAVVYTDAEGFARTEQVTWDKGAAGEGGSTVFTATSPNYKGGAAVLTIGADGSYSLTMKAPIAHAEQFPLASGSENEKTLRFDFTVVDGDGDTANGSLTVKVDDDTPSPLLNGVKTATLDDEAQDVFTPTNPGGVSGDVSPDIKMVSGGEGALFKMGADGLSNISVALPFFMVIGEATNGFAIPQRVTWGEGERSEGGVTTFKATVGSGDATKVVAELSIGADGSYEFQLNAPVLHTQSSTKEDNADLVFSYVVTDGDGDKAAGVLKISVDDDTPKANIEVGATVTLDDDVQALFAGNDTPDDGVTNRNLATGETGALFSAGADGVQAVTISGGAFDVVYKQGGLALTEAVIWGAGVKSADGKTTFIAKGEVSKQEAAELKINADGSYSFELKAPVVHSGKDEANDNKTISIGFEVVDGDGDKAGGQLYISVNDDAPVAKTVEVARQLDDEGQANGNPGAGLLFADSDAPGEDVTASGGAGTLFKAGADGLKSVSVVAPTFAVVYTDAEGFARTEQVTWDKGAAGEGGSTVFTATSPNYKGGAAVLTIGADGSYSLTMKAPIAHAEQFSLASGSENEKTLRFDFTVVDGDGDTANGSLTVKVDDDTPSPLLNGVKTATLDDEAQDVFTPTNPGGVSGDVSPDIKTVSGGEGALFKMGADGLSNISVVLPFFMVIGEATNGFAIPQRVTWGEGERSEGGVTTFKATVGSGDATKVVAELSIGADGSYEFQLNAPVLHTHSSTKEDNVDLVFSYVVTDGDGDKAAGVLEISVDDDTPKANIVIGETLTQESGVVGEDNIASGSIGTLFNAGADGVQSVSINGGAFSVAYNKGGSLLSEAVTWGAGVKSADGTTTFIAKGATSKQEAAVLKINADGSYSFELKAPLAGFGEGEAEKTISIGFDVVDGDGDKASGNLSVSVENIMPDALSDIRFLGNVDLDLVMGGEGGPSAKGPKGFTMPHIEKGKDLFTMLAADEEDEKLRYSFKGEKETQLNYETMFTKEEATLEVKAKDGVVDSDDKLVTDVLSPLRLTISSSTVSDGENDYTEAMDLVLGTGRGEGIDGSSVSRDQVIYGFGGDDDVTGGAGDDWMAGGEGYDVLTGGAGKDIFAFKEGDSATLTMNRGNYYGIAIVKGVDGYDVITDFNASQDKLEFGKKVKAVKDVEFKTGKPSDHIWVADTSEITVTTKEPISAHSIKDGIVTFFDTDGRVVTIDTEAELGAAIQYLDRNNGIAPDGGVVAFNATLDGKQNTFVFQDIHKGSEASYTVIALSGFVTSDFNALIMDKVVDPIVLDLDRDGFAFSSIGAGVTFDLDADGKGDQIAWTSADGILAYDLDGNGLIDNGSEIFTPDFNGGQFASGVAALASLDSNGDGKIDAGDLAFADLKVWLDANNNGVSDEGELTSLSDNGVTSISLSTDQSGGAEDGQTILAEGEFTFADGSTGNFMEVGLDAIFGNDDTDVVNGGMGEVMMTGGAGADTFVFDATALDELDVADVITDFNSDEGDVLDVTALLDSLLGEQATAETAASHLRSTVEDGNTTLSVQTGQDTWKDVAVLNNHDTAVKVLFDDKHAVTVTHD